MMTGRRSSSRRSALGTALPFQIARRRGLFPELFDDNVVGVALTVGVIVIVGGWRN